MRNILIVAEYQALFAAFFLLAVPAAAQSQNSQALTWFKTDLTEREPQKKNNLASFYEQAEGGDLTATISGSEHLLQQSGGTYQDTKVRLDSMPQQLAPNQLDAQLESDYAAGMAALRAREWTQAISAFEKVSKMNPNYREVAYLMAEAQNALQNQIASAGSLIDVDSLYQHALAAAGREEWIQAVVDFEKVQLLQPDHREVTDRLAEARAKLALVQQPINAAAPAATTGGLAVYLSGAAALLILPLLGFMAFLPATRARLQCLRGNYAAAAQIYEKILARNPDKLKIYPALANLYLLLGRNDESALKIYKTVLQLNLPTYNREELNVIVAQKYLVEGRTDSDAIEILEGALKAEQRRQQCLS